MHKTIEAQAEMTKREKVGEFSHGRVAKVSRSLELLLRKITSEFNFWRLKSHRVLINKYCATVERVKAKHPPPPPPRKGELLPYVECTGACCRTGYGFSSLSLNMVYNFMCVFPNRRDGQYD